MTNKRNLIYDWYESPTPIQYLGSSEFDDDCKCVCCGYIIQNEYLRVDLQSGIICDHCFFSGRRCYIYGCDNPSIAISDSCRQHYLDSTEVID